MSTVKVKIYGQEYTVSGDKSREYIMKVADYVDQSMHELAKQFPGQQPQALSVLSSLNTADLYFEKEARLAAREEACEEKDRELDRYKALWDEAKKNFLSLKEENERLASSISEMQNAASDCEKKVSDAEKKVKETESNFFDLQMENIRLKSEIEHLRQEQEKFLKNHE